jgi:DNA polymerase I-like protein with 3'-5' exonuclease and polymerase domains
MKVETAVAEAFQAQYFKRFPGISDWHVWVAHELQTKGYLVSPFGIRRTFWSRRWDDATLREAIAFVPQHCVGVLMNVGIYKLWERFEGKPGADVQILLNLHDAVLGQVRIDKADQLLPEILDCLNFPFPIKDIKGIEREIVIPFDVEIGYNWGKASTSNPGGLKKWRSNGKA